MKMKQKIKIYNTLSGKKETFVPIIQGHVGIYTCGPTVYREIHLGNCRTFIFFDLIVRYFKYLGYKVRYVRNITDVGHLEDEGEDKISKRARLERLEPMEITQKYTLDFHHILSVLNTLPPNIEPIATGHILEQIELIVKLIDKGLAYEINGSVYFDLKSYIQRYDYGILSHRNIEDLIANTRHLKAQNEKRYPLDFALWKKASPKHLMSWNSPWGKGFPGWHLECTAMSTKYLGNVFDIHGGGIDLKFPHHECELAQAKGLSEKNPVRYWMHVNMLTLKDKKMSKSSGHLILPSELFTGEKSFSANLIRFFMLQSHYRSVFDFSIQSLLSAEKGYHRLMKSFPTLKRLIAEKNRGLSTFDVKDWIQRCYDAMNDDFNSPKLISHLFEAGNLIESFVKGKEFLDIYDIQLLHMNLRNFLTEVLGVNIPSDLTVKKNRYHKLIDLLLEIRKLVRKEKKWDISDRIRNELFHLGYSLIDNEDGSTCLNPNL
ncbi:MAG: cysteine--tRNA ligase [Candidatus Walczuchella monophlebidarum]